MNKLIKSIKRKYYFLEYDPDWPRQFSIIKSFLKDVFGDKAIQIEHIGSTSIPEMKAKPVIDVLIVVEKMEQFEKQKEKMVEAGYEWLENYIAPDSLIFYKLGPEGEKLENIHILEVKAPKARQFIVMRDYLRTHPEKAKAYSEVKQKGFDLHPDDYPAYREVKAPLLMELESMAYEWDDLRNK
jgi:GrpB-like predicted nucleotidyltransferase (UPF0157 family)